MNARASIAALVLVAVSLAATAARGQQAGHAPARPPRPGRAGTASGASRPPGGPVRTALPDTVLARLVFAAGRTDLTATDFRSAAVKFNVDPDSLVPAARHQFLALMIQQAVLNHRIAQSPPRWLHRDSTNFDDYADGLVLRAALDSALADMRSRFAARGDSIPGREKLMIMVRDSAIATQHVVYDDTAIDSVTAAFLALPKDDLHLPASRRREILSELPRVSAADSTKVLGRCDVGAYTTRELLQDNAALGILKRPTVHTSRDVRDLVNDRLYTLLLRREAHRRHLDAQPDVAARIAVRRQFLTAQRFVQNEVYDRVPVDTATVGRYFARDPRRYDLGGSATIVRLLFGGRAEADSAAQALTRPGCAESLATQSQRTGIPNQATLGEDADTVLFGRVRRGGVGAVIGPDATADGWRVFKVMSTTPRQPQTLAEAFVRARADWLEEDGDRRMRGMMSALVAACRVTVNDSSSFLTGRRRAAP